MPGQPGAELRCSPDEMCCAAILTASATVISPVAAATHHVMVRVCIMLGEASGMKPNIFGPLQLSLFFFWCSTGDACSQAAQSFLPAVVSSALSMVPAAGMQPVGEAWRRPSLAVQVGSPKAAWRLGSRLLQTGTLIGAVNCLLAGRPSGTGPLAGPCLQPVCS